MITWCVDVDIKQNNWTNVDDQFLRFLKEVLYSLKLII